ncbi:DNA gyrase subunit A [bioreactor metagenome]|uniref:DNA topoisomerase (ATP-hydrolyzing) n=2 Tax=root TaxID=1 RepID=A0A644W0R3_9ZZZZ|nr:MULTISPECIES: DNA topoisomerase (ATP-hydrolyzing) subunit A [Sphaerochaeta]MDD3423337.1 DNA topoisomerase (ATP-hydrolyzing) subunit A [Sphaerochaeta sp.]MDT3359291.1 DNA topoisomerase (ATP-hydrolyzing) subunit A [Spirochaetota bacterium]MDX9982872.1 DNA topoisomerase (ATP-hydrolyzing) subunit A [Sphaerochaeta sp.]SMP50116.1 DNA gyrase subunit A [Sphaerochaeta associata]
MEEINESRTISVDVSKEMRTSYLNYAMSVIVSRALPDVRDGLKPVHRRILFDMFEMGLRANSSFKKCARIVGDVLGKYHPHGDASVYDALVRLAQDFSLRYPVVNPQGNFGSIDGDPAAAMRYTEAKMSRIGEEMLQDIQKETVNFGPNYDDSMQEPTVLPASFPFLLANGSSGIAVGMATNMAPHNLQEICDAISAVIDNPDITIDELMEHIKGPDFPSGGIICGMQGIKDAFTTGRGKIVVRSVYEIETSERDHDQIVFTEIPYQVNKADLVKKIDDLRKDGAIPMIAVVRDESDRKGIRIVVELKVGAEPMVVLNQLFARTALQSNFNVNNLALVQGRPQMLTLKDMLVYYIRHREEVVTRRTQYDLRKAQERAHILRGLKIGLDNIDEVIQIIKDSADNTIAAERLVARFGLDQIQAQAIIDMKLGRLSHLETSKILEELSELEQKIAYYQDLLADEVKILKLVQSEVRALPANLVPKDRRLTKIVREELGQATLEDFIKDEEVVVLISNKGFAKRIPTEEYEAHGRAGKGTRTTKLQDGDFVDHMFVASTHEYVMFVTNAGKAYYTKVFEIPEASKTAKGTSIKNILQLETTEKITSIISFKEFSEDHYLMMATREGVVKKVSLSNFVNAKVRGIRALFLDEGDELLSCDLIQEGDEVMLITKLGRGLRFRQEDVRAMGRASRGVRGIRLLGDDQVAGLLKVDNSKRILMITENGQGKQVTFDSFTVHGRGTQGQKIYRLGGKASFIVGVLSVDDDNDVVCVTLMGQTLRVHVNAISIQGRNAAGVKVVTMKFKGDSIVAIASTERDEDEEVEIPEQPAPESEEIIEDEGEDEDIPVEDDELVTEPSDND